MTSLTLQQLELDHCLGSSFAELEEKASLRSQLSMVAELASRQLLECTLATFFGSNLSSRRRNLPMQRLWAPPPPNLWERGCLHKLASLTKPTTTTTTTTRTTRACEDGKGRKLGSSKLSSSA